MALKLLLFSVKGTLADADNKLHREVTASFASLIRDLRANGVQCALWSTQPWTVGNSVKLEDYLSEKVGFQVLAFGPQRGGYAARRLGDAVAPILAHFGVEKHEAMLVGGTNSDMQAGVNNGLLHLRPTWYESQTEYGFPVASVSELARFCFVFALRRHPVFFRVPSASVAFAAAGPFTTMDAAFAQFGSDARSAAKFGQGHPEFWFSLCTSTLYFSGILEDVDYMCVYPGHQGHGEVDVTDSMEAALTRLGRCFNISFYHDLIARHVSAPKSQHTRAADRKFATQLNSIHLQGYPHRNLVDAPRKTRINLRDKIVLVVDDICTSGRSLEAARIYLEAAGADVRLFSWLKTVRTAYCEITDRYKFNPYAATSFSEPRSIAHAYESGITDPEAGTELAEIFKRYTSWPLK